MSSSMMALEDEFRDLLARHGHLVSGLNVSWSAEAGEFDAIPPALALLRRIDQSVKQRPPSPTPQPTPRPVLCLDFDGVMHSYTSGWLGVATIPDPPVDGVIPWIIEEAMPLFDVAVHSSRSGSPDGREAMRIWTHAAVQAYFQLRGGSAGQTDALTNQVMRNIAFPEHKPPAYVSIDDRAITFSGRMPPARALLQFRTWQQTRKGETHD